MAAAAVQLPTAHDLAQAPFEPQVQESSSTIPPTARKHDVETTLNFYQENEDGSPPKPTYIDRPETYDRPVATAKVTVKDIRGEEDQYKLDGAGFQVHKHVSVEKDFVDDNQIKAQYYPEVEQLIKDVTGASKVFIFDHTIRRHSAGLGFAKDVRGPVQRVHVDQSYAASLSRVQHHLPDEADTLLKGRVQIINVWRPIRQVLRDPLAVAVADSVNDEDLIVHELIYPDRRGETYGVRHQKEQQWRYKSGLEPSEVLLIKCFDSKKDGRSRRVPHSAFVDPAAGPDVPTRESIEVRTLVFHADDTLE